MTENLLVQYVIFTVLNVIIQTAKSVMTIKCNKYIASIASAVAYGFYTYIIVLTLCDLPMLEKCIITALANLVGVFVVKWIEEKAEKNKLWKIELTVPTKYIETVDKITVPHSYIQLSDKHTVFNFYCATPKETEAVKHITQFCDAKYFIAEAKQEIL